MNFQLLIHEKGGDSVIINITENDKNKIISKISTFKYSQVQLQIIAKDNEEITEIF